MSLTDEALERFESCKNLSEDGLEKMRSAAIELFSDADHFIIGINGSYARREATAGSDVDLFFLAVDDDPSILTRMQAEYNQKLIENGFKLPDSGGVFQHPLSVNQTRYTIGGLDDTNESITRRMLLLLEGEHLFNKHEFDNARASLIDRYIDDDQRAEQICLFLLNDIIRYWRTICVDFEFKIREGEKAKAIRLIKLRFSRMMLYVAGVLAVGETFDKSRDDKKSILIELLSIPPVFRFQQLAGIEGEPALELYAEFLNALDDSSIRNQLEQLSPEGEKTRVFSEMRHKAQQFRDTILDLLESKYSEGNPTRRALML